MVKYLFGRLVVKTLLSGDWIDEFQSAPGEEDSIDSFQHIFEFHFGDVILDRSDDGTTPLNEYFVNLQDVVSEWEHVLLLLGHWLGQDANYWLGEGLKEGMCIFL